FRPDERAAAYAQRERLVVELALANQLEPGAGVGSNSAGLLFGAAGIGASALRFGLYHLRRTRRLTGCRSVPSGIDRTLEGDLVQLVAGAELAVLDYELVHQRQAQRLVLRFCALWVGAEYPVRAAIGRTIETHVRANQRNPRQHDRTAQQRPEAQLQVDALDRNHVPATGPGRIPNGEPGDLHMRTPKQRAVQRCDRDRTLELSGQLARDRTAQPVPGKERDDQDQQDDQDAD